jgi:hypothetical protein
VSPSLVLDTGTLSVAQSVELVIDLLKADGLIWHPLRRRPQDSQHRPSSGRL